MNVDSAIQRLGLRSLLPQGNLVAGLGQWLGIAIAPQHDSLTDASVQLQPLLNTSREGKGPVILEVKADKTAWIVPIKALQGRLSMSYAATQQSTAVFAIDQIALGCDRGSLASLSFPVQSFPVQIVQIS